MASQTRRTATARTKAAAKKAASAKSSTRANTRMRKQTEAVRNLASGKVKKPRAPRPSDITAMYRKRLKRRIQKMEKAQKNATKARRQIDKQLAELRDMLAGTYEYKGKDLQNYLKKVEERVPANRGRVRRSDTAFKRKMNEMNTSQSNTDLVNSKVFWQVTKDVWLGAPREERATLIKKAYGVDTLQEAYNIVMDSTVVERRMMMEQLGAYDEQGRMASTDLLVADAEDPYDAIKPLLGIL